MYAPAYNGMGLVNDKMGNYEEALEDFNLAIKIDSNNPVYIHNRGCCKRSMEKLEEAMEDFKKALSLDTKNPIIFSNMGLVLRKLEDYESAIYCFQQEMLLMREETPKSLNNRGYCLAKVGRVHEAIADYDNVLS